MTARMPMTLVLDVGKTHAKLLLIDDAGDVVSRQTHVNQPLDTGTYMISLSGHVKRPGNYELAHTLTWRELIYDIGGGIPGEKRLKAVQTGGPSGGCIPSDLIDLPVDYESLKKSGSMMGSGGMIVMDEDTCMVDLARYFMSFTQEESCGKDRKSTRLNSCHMSESRMPSSA